MKRTPPALSLNDKHVNSDLERGATEAVCETGASSPQRTDALGYFDTHLPVRLLALSTSLAALSVVLLMVSCCTAQIEATATPVVTMGTSVFSGIYWTEPDKAIDIVFVPDDDYGDMTVIADRQNFLDDVSSAINSGYWENNVYFKNFLSTNFWFMTDTADVQPPVSGTCPRLTIPNLDDAAFAEQIIILHPNPLRDCAWGNIVTSEPTSFGTMVHESGHAVFMLPDEYCCDGGYWEQRPILYETEASCEGDPITHGGAYYYNDETSIGTEWVDCQSFTDVNNNTWWRSEDDIPCIMRTSGVVAREFGPADLWHINVMLQYYLDQIGTVQRFDVYAPTPWP